MGSVRKNYPAALKVNVALAALKEDKTLAQLSSEFGVHTHQIQEWKKRLLAEAPAIFFHATESRRTRCGSITSGVISSNWAIEGGSGLVKKRVETSH